MTTHHKSAQEENFPVAFCLFPKQHRRLVEVYYRFAREADDIADAPDLTNQKKLAKLAEMADSLYGKSTQAKSAVNHAHTKEMLQKNKCASRAKMQRNPREHTIAAHIP